MRNVIADQFISGLIPILTEAEKEDLRTYFVAYEKYEKAFAEAATEELRYHPVFGKLIQSIPKDVAEARNKFTHQLQRDAVMFDMWEPYVNYQMEQGINYAKMDLSFKSWYEVILLVRKFLTPCLQKEYTDHAKLMSALNGMNLMMDIGMSIIAEAYMKERNDIIKEEQEKLKKLNTTLEEKVLERTSQLETINRELEAFSYSVSHDLRAPLRAINGYAEMLNEDYGNKLNEDGVRIIKNITHYAVNMGNLIDELLSFSRLGKKELQKISVNMNDLVEGVIISLNKTVDHHAKIHIGPMPAVTADYSLIYQVVFNLLSNAIKYSSKKENPMIEISAEEKATEYVFSIKDNGVGFDMKYADKLFKVFQRLHDAEEFEGSGIGLAIVLRLVTKHGGQVWAEAKLNEGAKFYFSLPK